VPPPDIPVTSVVAAIDHLIASGYIETPDWYIVNYKHKAKAELLPSELCIGIGGG
jgi:hypothetical protein